MPADQIKFGKLYFAPKLDTKAFCDFSSKPGDFAGGVEVQNVRITGELRRGVGPIKLPRGPHVLDEFGTTARLTQGRRNTKLTVSGPIEREVRRQAKRLIKHFAPDVTYVDPRLLSSKTAKKR